MTILESAAQSMLRFQRLVFTFQDPELADIRNELIKATETGDVDSLAHWIDRFTERHMHDNGDLQKAKRKLLVAKLNRGITTSVYWS